MPKKLGECLLQIVPHLPGRLNHMYVMWKIAAGKARPIVPVYASPTALAARSFHEQRFPYMKQTPTSWLDSLFYTEELHRLERDILYGAELFITAEKGGVAKAKGEGEKEKECTTECKSRRRWGEKAL